MPHIWCPGCGIGTTVNCFARALLESKLDLEQGRHRFRHRLHRAAWPATCSLDSFHTTHGRAIPFATGLKLANPDLNVVVYSGDGDLSAIGGNHLIHAARRNMDIKVICVNNLIYAMTGGQTAPTTPGRRHHLHVALRRLRAVLQPAAAGRRRGRRPTWRAGPPSTSSSSARSMNEMLQQEGLLLHRGALALPDALPAPQQAGRRPGHHEVLQGERARSATARPPARPRSTMQGEIVVGKFVDRERPDYLRTAAQPDAPSQLGDRYVEPECCACGLTEIRVAGFGGQGVILAATIIGKAASIFQGGYATMTQSFGPEARGGSSSAQVILSDEPILYPYVTQPGHSGGDVAGGLHALRAGAEAAAACCSSSRTWCASPDLRQGMRVLRRSRHAPGRGTGPQDGAQHGDGGLLRRGNGAARPGRAAPGGGGFRAARPCRSSTWTRSTKGYEYGARLIESLGRSRRTEPVSARLEHEV